MKFIRHTALKLACFALLAAVLAAALIPTSLAAEAEWDASRPCSITVSTAGVMDESEGASLSLYRIGDISAGTSGGRRIAYLPAYEGLESEIGMISELTERTAENVWAYIVDRGYAGSTADQYADGDAVWLELSAGLYLVAMNDPADAGSFMEPFLIALPYLDEDGGYVYDVYASPKYETFDETLLLDVLSIRKTVEGGNGERSVFRFAVRRLSPEYPMPFNGNGSVDIGGPVVSRCYDEMVLQLYGAGELDIGTITFLAPGDYYYEIREFDLGGNFKYDDSVYWCRFTIGEDDNGLVCENITIRRDDANGEILYSGNGSELLAVNFTNTFVPEGNVPQPSTDKILPQTGGSWLLPLMLAVAGAILVGIGEVKRRRHED